MSTEPSQPLTPSLVYQTLLGEAAESAVLGVSVYADDGRMVAVNRHAAEMLGYAREELLEHDVADFTEGGIDRGVLFKQERREGVRLVQRKDGSSIPVAFVVAPATIANLQFFVAISWRIADDDPRATGAT